MEKSLYIQKYKSLFIMLICIVSTLPSFSQYVNDFKKSADYYYAKADYYSAAVYYEKYMDQKSGSVTGLVEPYSIQNKPSKKQKANQKAIDDRQEITYRLAESYRMLNDYGQAEKWYAEALKANQDNHPDMNYWYAVSLRANGKYAEAQEQLKKYLASKEPIYKEQAKLELANNQFIVEQLKRDVSLYHINKIEGAINSTGANYASAWNNNAYFFTSTRTDGPLENKEPFKNALYQAKQTSTGNTVVEKFNIPTSKDMEQGVASFNAEGTKLYLTRWIKKAGVNKAAIYVSEIKAGLWSEPKKLGENINVAGFSSQQPYITADNKYLLFSTDKPGGSGKFDLWYALLDDNGEPGEAVNFGANINTKEDDQAPFYHQKTGTLVFSSKGKIGLGGFDLYESKGAIGGKFEDPKNLGYPINSIKDDIYFSSKESSQLLTDATLSSDRASSCCLGLFSVSKSYKKYVTGLIADSQSKQMLKGVNVKFLNNNEAIKEVTTNQDGKYLIELDEFMPLMLNASAPSYQASNLNFFKPDTENTDTLYLNDILLVAEEVQKPKEQKVYFDFDEYNLSQETLLSLNKLGEILKRESKLGLEISGYTDNIGSEEYNLILSRNRAIACKEYLIKMGIAANRLEALGKGKCCTSNNESKDRRAEFRILLLE